MATVALTKREEKLVQRIAKLQLESFKEIRANNVEDQDIVLYCIETGITLQELEEHITKNERVFRDIQKKPKEFIQFLDEDNKSIFQHILTRFFKSSQYNEAKRRLKRVMLLTESINLN